MELRFRKFRGFGGLHFLGGSLKLSLTKKNTSYSLKVLDTWLFVIRICGFSQIVSARDASVQDAVQKKPELLGGGGDALVSLV